jgi:hypothetical protein
MTDDTTSTPDSMPDIRRLLHAVSNDFSHASQYAKAALHGHFYDSAALAQEDHIILRALSLAAVIAYTRPFGYNRGNGDHPMANRLPDSIKASLSPDEQAFHKRILCLRNKALAHSDACLINANLTVHRPPDGGPQRVIAGTLSGAASLLDRTEMELLRTCADKAMAASLCYVGEIADPATEGESG